MDLSTATSAQRQIITTLDAPLSVAAGAGSGKTFTLTNRIGYAFLGDADHGPLIERIDEVLAITFTKAGASEMKARMRALLQDEGLAEQARAVENAWISTIHGMCSRILREHALELGLDPAFTVVSESESDEMWRCALEEVMTGFAEGEGDARFKRLFSWFPEQNGPRTGGLASFLTAIRERVLGMPAGFESVLVPGEELDLAATLRSLIELAQDYQLLAQSWGGKMGKRDQEYLDALEGALEGAIAYQQRTDLVHAHLADPSFDVAEYLGIIHSFPPTSAKYRAGKEDEAFFVHYRRRYAELADAASMAVSAAITRDLVDLARLVDAAYQRLKGPMRLDNTDLLRICDTALAAHPQLCAAYRDQFALIMVDEFQDTDLLQVAIIDKLSRDHGANVMTVGDAQQGIYRFRGADVEVFFRHRAEQRARHDSFQAISLPDNFRSHGDILAFVDAIFSRREFFGDDFLSLEPRGAVNDEVDAVFATEPRVEVDVFETRARVSTADSARARSARAIAARFARLRAAGASPSEMVILLGGMPHADIYAAALAEEGFESLIAGGTVFASALEVHLVNALLTLLADPANSTALYTVLSSPLFNLSDDVLCTIGRARISDEVPRSASFARCFAFLLDLFRQQGRGTLEYLLASQPLGSADRAELIRAFELVSGLVDAASRFELASGLEQLFLDSGWLLRLQSEGADGLAVAANLFKCVELVRGWEGEQMGLQRIAANFADAVRSEKPGSLSALDTRFVRIMTIHASKGLEFSHVAVAEVPDGKPKASALRADTLGDHVLLALQAPLSAEAKKVQGTLRGFLDRDGADAIALSERASALDPSAFSALLDARICQGALADAQRLLYVALTRASKSLCLCLSFQGNAKFDYAGKALYGQLAEVFAWDRAPEPKCSAFEYGGSAPARIHHEVLANEGEIPSDIAASPGAFIAVVPEPSYAHEVPLATERANVVSYSSLAPGHSDVSGAEEEQYAFVAECEETDAEPVSAVALGTAFHLLAQRMIESRASSGQAVPLAPELIRIQALRNELSADQALRLEAAIERWQDSALCARFMSYPRIAAEVPFMLALDTDSDPLFLEGEIDGLAWGAPGEEGAALLIDYKTGGNDDETDAQLQKKHLLQAQCYALALIRAGFERIEANFIRVERPWSADPDQPQVVRYSFVGSDAHALERAIVSAAQAERRSGQREDLASPPAQEANASSVRYEG